MSSTKKTAARPRRGAEPPPYARMTDDEVRVLLHEEDDFRLAIRGFTVIEKMIDDAIADALPGLWAGKLRTFGGFRSRLELAVALAILPGFWTPAIRELAQLRNDFAHGKIEHLNRARVRRLQSPSSRWSRTSKRPWRPGRKSPRRWC